MLWNKIKQCKEEHLGACEEVAHHKSLLFTDLISCKHSAVQQTIQSSWTQVDARCLCAVVQPCMVFGEVVVLFSCAAIRGLVKL